MRGLVVAAIMTPLMVGAATASELQIGAAGGVYAPYDSEDDPYEKGFVLLSQLLWVGDNEHLRWGGELQLRSFEADRDDDHVQLYTLQALFHYRILPNEVVNPYLGVGAGMTLVDLNEDETFGGVGLVGVEFKLEPAVMFFVEGRATIDIPVENDFDEDELSGLGGIAGFRVAF
jgi:opacity protein-like surface antigen